MLPDCLRSLAATLKAGDEMIVVESGDSGASKAIEFLESVKPRVIHIRTERSGKSHQLNLGIRASSGDVLLLTDDDVLVEPDWAEKMVSCFTEPTVGVACGRVEGLSVAPAWDPAYSIPAGEAPFETWSFAHGAAMAVRTKAAWDAGGMDERLGPGTPAGGEDHDFVLRIRQRGWRVFVASAPAAHHIEWRSPVEDLENALSYERGSGAILGAAIRRHWKQGLRLAGRRLIYQSRLIKRSPRFGLRALPKIAGGFLYGLQLKERDWLRLDPTPTAEDNTVQPYEDGPSGGWTHSQTPPSSSGGRL